MRVRDPTLWMWGEALEMLERADRMQRQFCQLGANRQACPTWEPPVDVFETGRQFMVVVALPGVSADQLEVELVDATIVVRGQRRLPGIGIGAHLHRLELPYGRFERRVELPVNSVRLRERSLEAGCLTLVLDKPGAGP